MNLFYEELGKMLKELREKQGLTQKEVANRLFINYHQQISRWESGERRPSIEDLAYLLFELGNETLTIKDKQIKIGEVKMTETANNMYENFMDFKYSEYVKGLENRIEENHKLRLKNYDGALKLAEEKGVKVDGLKQIEVPYLEANENYPELLITLSGPNGEWEKGFDIGVVNFGYSVAEAFDFFGFLNEVERHFPQETVVDLRKAIIFECLKGAGGREIFNFFMLHYRLDRLSFTHGDDLERLMEKCSYLKPFKNVFNKLLSTSGSFIIKYDGQDNYNTHLLMRDFNYWMLCQLGLVDERYSSRWQVCVATDYAVEPFALLEDFDIITEDYLWLGDAIVDVIENYEEYKGVALEYLADELEEDEE